MLDTEPRLSEIEHLVRAQSTEEQMSFLIKSLIYLQLATLIKYYIYDLISMNFVFFIVYRYSPKYLLLDEQRIMYNWKIKRWNLLSERILIEYWFVSQYWNTCSLRTSTCKNNRSHANANKHITQYAQYIESLPHQMEISCNLIWKSITTVPK